MRAEKANDRSDDKLQIRNAAAPNSNGNPRAGRKTEGEMLKLGKQLSFQVLDTFPWEALTDFDQVGEDVHRPPLYHVALLRCDDPWVHISGIFADK